MIRSVLSAFVVLSAALVCASSDSSEGKTLVDIIEAGWNQNYSQIRTVRATIETTYESKAPPITPRETTVRSPSGGTLRVKVSPVPPMITRKYWIKGDSLRYESVTPNGYEMSS